MPHYDNYFQLRPTRFGFWLQTGRAKLVLRHLVALKPDLERVLEIGPGWGEFAEICRESGRQYRGIDINFAGARAMQNTGIETLVAATPPIPLASNQFDTVVAQHVLEHMPDSTTAIAFLKEMIRVTRPDGLICLNCPDLLAAGHLFWDTDYTHNFPTTKRRLNQMFLDQQVEVLEAQYFAGLIGGALATPISWAARYFPAGLLGLILKPVLPPERINRLRLSFIRNILMIGRKPVHD